jgi:Spx/MgsR family transcriptional regulator
LLAEHDVDFERRDYFGDPFSVEELRSLLETIDMNPSEVLSKRSKAYKDLGLDECDVSDEELLGLMIEHPTLLRRPIVVRDGQVVIGFNRARIEELIS